MMLPLPRLAVQISAQLGLLLTLTRVWCRVEAAGNRRVIDDLLKADMLEVLRANDQLKRERKLGRVFMVSMQCLLQMTISPQQSMQVCPPLSTVHPSN